MELNYLNFFTSSKNKKIDVIGFGVSNTDLIFRFAENGARVCLHDKKSIDKIPTELLSKFKEYNISLSLGDGYLSNLNGDYIIRTPGMYANHPVLVDLRKKGLNVTSEMELFMELAPCKKFGISGSDGKTTTTSLIAEFLKEEGKNVYLGGNIGAPLLCNIDKLKPTDVAVVELSSFQLLDMHTSPDVALITNISPNHLDVHKTMEEYIFCKKNLILYQNKNSKTVLSHDSKTANDLKEFVKGDYFEFSRTQKVKNGSWMDENGDLYFNNTFIMNKKDIKIPGLHNVENVLAAIAAVWGDVSIDSIIKVVKNFPGVAHRIEFVREVNKVKYYNDSIATSPTRTIAGLNSFNQKIIIIAGGYDKGLDYTPLAKPIVDKVKTLILTGDTSNKIESAVKKCPSYNNDNPDILYAKNLEDAVFLAHKYAEPGDIVSLSPASASFDSFANFEERGNYFKKLVNSLEEN